MIYDLGTGPLAAYSFPLLPLFDMSLAGDNNDVQLAELPRQHREPSSRSIGAGSDKSVTLPFSGDGSLSEPSADLSQKPRWRATAHRLGERFPRARRAALYALGPQPPVYMSGRCRELD